MVDPGPRVLVAVFAATPLVNGVTGAFGRRYPLRLVALAPSLDPVVWLTGPGVVRGRSPVSRSSTDS